jgi:hypothetical protein
MPARAAVFVLAEMVQAADMGARYAADKIAVADEVTHVLATVFVAAAERARYCVGGNKINPADFGDALE